MKCPKCNGSGEFSRGWMSEPCAYCGGTGELPDDFSEMTKLKRCKKCGGIAVFSGVFDDPTTYRFPECIDCGRRAKGNSTDDSWYERARKWNEQNTPTHEEWFASLSTEEKAVFMTLFSLRRANVYDKTFYETAADSANEAAELTVGTKKLKAYKELLAWLKGEHKA